MTEEKLPLCECGCGLRVTKPGNRFIHGHHRRGDKNSPEHNAAISATLTDVSHTPERIAAISKGVQESDAVKAHNESMRGVPLSPETCDAMSKAHTGKTFSQGHCAAISKAHTGVPLSPDHCATLENHWENMRGGNDICDHHYIYDHNDLSLNTVKMTRSNHASLHNILRNLGYIVPHINVKENINNDNNI